MQVRYKPAVPPEQLLRNVGLTRSLGLPYVGSQERPPLMVLGGGRSIAKWVDEVKASPADKWAIGSAFNWWWQNGVDATFYSIHPSPAALGNIEGVSRAILATQTDPEVFAALESADVQVFDLADGGATSATYIPALALRMGYQSVTFYGCESNYDATTHLYMDTQDPYWMAVSCNGDRFLTGAEFLMQAEFLAATIRRDKRFRERSGGLLRAMVRSPRYKILHTSPAVAAAISEVRNG